MKKFSTVVLTMLLAGSLVFAQNTGGDQNSKPGTGTTSGQPTKTTSGKKASKTKSKKHKGGKKAKKSSPSTTPAPK